MRLTLLLFLIYFSQLKAQNFFWANCLQGKGTSSLTNLSPGTSICNSIAVDNMNNVYVAGYLNDSVDVDPSSSTNYLVGGNDDIYFAKYDANGNLIWANVIPSQGWNYATDILIDKTNNVIISGHCSSLADFDPGPGTLILPQQACVAYSYIAKYNSSGNLIWAKSFGDQYASTPSDLAIDNNNNIYITGTFFNTLDFDPSANTAYLNSNGTGVYFAKYDANGNYIWAKQLSGVGQYGGASSLECSDNGNIFLSGYFGGTVDFNPGSSTNHLTAITSADRYFAKYDSNGNYIWANSINVNENGYLLVGRSIELAIDAQENIILTGNFNNNVDFDPSPNQNMISAPSGYSTFICKYDIVGNLTWAKAIIGNFCISNSITMDCEDNFYLTGPFGSADFDPSVGVVNLTSNAPLATMNFIAKYDINGNYKWATRIGNNGYGSGTIPSVITVKDDKQYVAGAFKQSADFDPSNNNYILSASGVGHNTFFAVYQSSSPIHSAYNLNLGNDTTICLGNYLSLTSSLINASYLWQDNSTINPYIVTNSGTYWLDLSYRNCSYSDTIKVDLKNCETVFEMPNIFTPNGDGMNDYFLPKEIQNIEAISLMIYNRWGQKVYETKSLTSGWNGKYNGKESDDGTYYWIVNYSTYSNSTNTAKGYLTLIR